MLIMVDCFILSAFSNTKTNILTPLGFREPCLIKEVVSGQAPYCCSQYGILSLLCPLLTGSLQQWHDGVLQLDSSTAGDLQQATGPLSLPPSPNTEVGQHQDLAHSMDTHNPDLTDPGAHVHRCPPQSPLPCELNN